MAFKSVPFKSGVIFTLENPSKKTHTVETLQKSREGKRVRDETEVRLVNRALI